MMKSKSIFFFCLLFPFFGYSQHKVASYEEEGVTYIYHQKEGRFNGKYVSFYKNGLKKAEGTFENNLRIGKWTVWDSTGILRMQREYSDQFTFKRLIPEVPKDKPIQLLNTPQYKIEYNKEGFIPYSYVKEAWVLYHKRTWRYLLPENNPILFENERLIKLFTKGISDSTIIIYSEDEFWNKKPIEIETPLKFKIIAYKVKEEFFFDMHRVISDVRIIGVCPVAINLETKDTVDLYWIYYPYLRKILAQEKIEKEGVSTKIKTLDDLFFFKYFDSQIYKMSSIYDRKVIDFSQLGERAKESEKKEIFLIEKEHDIWISLTKPPKD